MTDEEAFEAWLKTEHGQNVWAADRPELLDVLGMEIHSRQFAEYAFRAGRASAAKRIEARDKQLAAARVALRYIVNAVDVASAGAAPLTFDRWLERIGEAALEALAEIKEDADD